MVRILKERLRRQDVKVAGELRRTGAGHCESVTEDPDGNPAEITCEGHKPGSRADCDSALGTRCARSALSVASALTRSCANQHVT
ncbi:MAG: VOC family protein [Verrucomicrobiota bacterium]